MIENKEHITHQLMLCLLSTWAGRDIDDMAYLKTKYQECVNITFKDKKYMSVDVTADSGIALIKDVIKALT